MKKILFAAMLFFGAHAEAQSYEVERLILDIEKLTQLKDILSDLYKGYEILNNGYNTIKNISEGNFNLHQAFLDGLLIVSPAVRNYPHAADIISMQASIVSEYAASFKLFKQDKHFNPDEIVYLGSVYNNIISASLSDLTGLLNILTDKAMRMSDDERLHGIDAVYADTKNKLMFLRQFNASTSVLAAQRAAEANDATTLKNLYK
ncbi:MAG: TerB family tellurite resistance protein [Bacteroidetes bacterium]|nr:TerB family tellurite resistance protein [Bacteroidota bacterium]